MLQKVMTKVSGNPGGAVFKDGSKFPNTVIVSPMVLIHHFAFNYEALIKKVTAVLEESDTVAVDMTSDCCCVFSTQIDALQTMKSLNAHGRWSSISLRIANSFREHDRNGQIT